jgi:hypothetical protein
MVDKINIKKLFADKQNLMLASFGLNSNFNHPVSKGDATEKEWIKWFNENFPTRYRADSGFVIDYCGNISEQIDIIIYDTYYSPIIFETNGEKYISVESVYAVFEVKQELNAEYIEYAKKKVASVRKLQRTNGCFTTYDGRTTSKKGEPLPQIIGGLLTLKCEWKNIVEKIKDNLLDTVEKNELNFICCLKSLACEIKYMPTGIITREVKIIPNTKNGTLLYAYFKLLRMLQLMGNAPAIEYSKYGIEG